MDFDNFLEHIDDKLLHRQSLTEEEESFLLDALGHSNVFNLAKVGATILEADLSFLKKLFDHFSSLPEINQAALIPILATFNINQPYKFLIEYMKKVKNYRIHFVIIKSLAETDYFVFPLILFYLDDKDPVFSENLRKLLFQIGFAKIKTYLMLFPEIPHEEVFRDVFGDPLIDELKKD